MKGYLKETDVTAPFPHGGWQYFERTYEGLPYKASIFLIIYHLLPL